MDSAAQYALLTFGSLFAVLNPVATVPPFLAMTEGNSKAQRARMASRACLIACTVLVVFVLSGMRVLNFFGVSVPAFQIAGGLVLIRVAFDLLQGGRAKVTPEEYREGEEKDDISITPLGVPILCGPATITTGILLSSTALRWFDTGLLVAVIVAMYVGLALLLRIAGDYADRLGQTPIKITSRLMGLILVAVAVQFMVDGLRAAQLSTSL